MPAEAYQSYDSVRFVQLALQTLESVEVTMVGGEGKTAPVGRSLTETKRQTPHTEGFTALQPFKS